MAGRRRRSLVVAVTDARGRRVASSGLARWLAGAAPRRARGVVTVALLSDAAMRTLNRRYRRKDYATDVLSFPVDGPQGSGPRPQGGAMSGSPKPEAQGRRPMLGDIAIATGVARRQARLHGHRLSVEVRLLALHGLLHLLGYDHEADRGEMQRMEDRLRRRSGLPRGVVARATGQGRR